ncbi:MAG: hypothetical protein QW514_07140 [Thermoprotei archaeon]
MNKLRVGLDYSLAKCANPLTIVVDALGIKVHNGGGEIRHVWRVKKAI